MQIKNLGRATETFTLKGRSRRIKFEPEQVLGVKLNPSQSTIITFRPQPLSFSLIGGTITPPFRLRIQSSSGEIQILKGEVYSQAKLSLKRAFILLLFLLPFFYFFAETNNSDRFSFFKQATPTPTMIPPPPPQPRSLHIMEKLYTSPLMMDPPRSGHKKSSIFLQKMKRKLPFL